MNEIFEKKITVTNKYGLHIRAAEKLLNLAETFQAEIYLSKPNDKKPTNAKSIMNLLTLSAKKGQELNIICSGEEAKEALKAVIKLFADKFGEDE